MTKIKTTDITGLDAVDVAYDNSSSGMSATDAQAAIDETEARVDILETTSSAAVIMARMIIGVQR